MNKESTKKIEIYEYEAIDEEIKAFDSEDLTDYTAACEKLQKEGRLEEPEGKKLKKNLFEIRCKGPGRVFYCYLDKYILILRAYRKKRKEVPEKEFKTALRRRKMFEK